MFDGRSDLRVPAIEVRQSPGRLLYSFAVDGKQIPTFATVSRIRRNGTELQGYQRPEVLSHIAEIRAYLESGSPEFFGPVRIYISSVLNEQFSKS